MGSGRLDAGDDSPGAGTLEEPLASGGVVWTDETGGLDIGGNDSGAAGALEDPFASGGISPDGMDGIGDAEYPTCLWKLGRETASSDEVALLTGRATDEGALLVVGFLASGVSQPSLMIWMLSRRPDLPLYLYEQAGYLLVMLTLLTQAV